MMMVHMYMMLIFTLSIVDFFVGAFLAVPLGKWSS